MERSIFFSLLVASACISCTAPPPNPQVVETRHAEVVPFPGHDVAVLAHSSATPGRAAVLELDLPPRTFGAPPHVHSREDEHFYVLEGQVEFLDRERTISAGPGTLVILPRNHLHGFWNASERPARLLLIVTPGEFASFFDQVVAEIRVSQPNDAQGVGHIIGETAAAHGVQVFPERVPASAEELLPR